MNSKKIIASLLSVGVLALTVSGASAFQGNPGAENPDCTDTERHAAVEQMFSNKDYSAFQTLYADKGVSRRITTEAQFEKFTALRAAQLAGATDVVNSLKAELNLGQRRMDGAGHADGERKGQGKRSGGGNGQGRGNK